MKQPSFHHTIRRAVAVARASGLSAEELAKRAKIQRSGLVRYCNRGEGLSARKLEQLAISLGFTLKR